jgi:hypothetical protein
MNDREDLEEQEMTVSTQFRIRLIAGSSVSLGFGVENMSIDIWDVANARLCTYQLQGVSVGNGTPISVSLRGPWNDFTVESAMSCDDFAGVARFATVFVMDKSLNALELTPIGRRPVTVAPFVTGWTLGFGAAAGGGAFTRMFPSIDSSKAMWPHNVE